MPAKQPAGYTPGFGRLPITDVQPVIEHGAYPAKATLGELAPLSATVFREGHAAVGARAVLFRPDGDRCEVELRQVEPYGLDTWVGWFRFDALGDWEFRIEAFDDRWHTWCHEAEIKLRAGIDTELVLAEGHQLFAGAARKATRAHSPALELLRAARSECTRTGDVTRVLDLLNSAPLDAAMRTFGPRPLLTPSATYRIRVQRKLAQFAAWYEFFPRSIGAHQTAEGWVSGTFEDCDEMLERVARLGFDVVYLPPIHPVGTTFRKGPNNSLTPAPDDPGSPWAIGASAGGHDAVHPELGGLAGFQHFVAKATSLGLEVALDFALQASPDHPWLHEHPEWFVTRVDGTIAYAENPPKKYQDIYPLNFDDDPQGLAAECLRIIRYWISQGVKIFRVDNPHTKPISFWAWLIEEVNRTNPEVIFLSEAFTRPAMLQALAKIGFQESYSYFIWRDNKYQLSTYLDELAHESAWFLRPNFFVNTPDINPFFVRSGLESAFAIRLILAATMSPAWGMYSGFELLECAPLHEAGEEYQDSEKYQYRPRDFSVQPNLDELIGLLNRIRKAHPALQQLHQSQVLATSSDDIFAFCKRDGSDTVIVVCSVHPEGYVAGNVFVDPTSIGLAPGASFDVQDELTGASFTWSEQNYVQLSPAQPAHILVLRNANV